MLYGNGRQAAAIGDDGQSLGELLGTVRSILRQQYSVIAFMTLLGVCLGALVVYVTPPVYKASATMIIERGKLQLLQQLGGVAEGSLDFAAIDSQMQLIQSETISLAVVKKLKLYEDLEFIGPAPGLRQWIGSFLQPSPPNAAMSESETDRVRAALASLAGRLKVDRLSGNIIEIETQSQSARRAAEIANAFASAYIEDQLNSRTQAARQGSSWLQERISELGDQSSNADEAVQNYKLKNNIVSADGRLITDQQLAELNSRLVLARERTTETKARLDRIEAILTSGPADDGSGGSVTDMMSNPVISRLRSQYLELLNRKADWSQRFGKNHLAVVNLERQIQEIRHSMDNELGRIAENYKSEFTIAKQQEAELEKIIASAVSKSENTGQAQIELRQLESSAATFRDLYKTVVQRNMELIQQQTFPGSEARLITPASPPTSKSNVKSTLILLVSSLGGLMFGLGIAVLRTTLDRVFRTSRQVETALGAKCLALVPMFKQASGQKIPQPVGDSRVIARRKSVMWEAIDSPLGQMAESMRSIKSATREMALDSPAKVLGFTSSLPDEGKSTIAASFALQTAQAGARAILVDCDLRNPSLSDTLAPGAQNGLLEVLSGKVPLDDVLWKDPTTNLTFLPTVADVPIANSSEILASSDLRKLFAQLRKTYDWVIVDFSPVAPIVDVRSTKGLVDSYVYVIEWGRTNIDMAESDITTTEAVNENLLGIVLNKANYDILDRYDGVRREYYAKYYSSDRRTANGSRSSPSQGPTLN